MKILKNIKRPEHGFESWQQISEQDIVINLGTKVNIGVVVAMKSEILQVIKFTHFFGQASACPFLYHKKY